MSFIIGKITRKVTKQHKEYFVGRVGNMPVRAGWAKVKDDLYLFLDKKQINFLSEKNKPAAPDAAVEEGEKKDNG